MWSFLKAIGNFYLYSSLHISLCAALLTLESFYILGENIQWELVLFVGLSTMAVYSAHRLVGMSKVKAFENQGRYRVIKKYRHHILVYFGISFLFSVYFFFKLDFRQMQMMVVPGILTVAYVLPIFKTRRLRDFPFIKIFLIAIVWTWMSLILVQNDATKQVIFLLSVERLLFFIAITLPFDIRDMLVDESIGVKTLVHKLGVDKTKRAAGTAFIICTLIIAYLWFFRMIPASYFISLLTCYLITTFLIYGSNHEKGDYYFGGFLDGIIGLRFILYLILMSVVI